MADIPQVLATYDALVGVALGAGLTYGFGALNRHHQEKREDETRWYEERLRAYVSLPSAVIAAVSTTHAHDEITREHLDRVFTELTGALAAIRFVGSEEAAKQANRLFDTAMWEIRGSMAKGDRINADLVNSVLMDFQAAARKDLGHP
jgi:hypothetical protein